MGSVPICRRACIFAVIVLSAAGQFALAQEQAGPNRSVFPQGEIRLVRFIDLLAETGDIPILYDPTAIDGTVGFRVPAGLTEDDAWAMLNSLLAERGLASILAGSGRALRIVSASDAKHLAPLEEIDLGESFSPRVRASYRRLAKRLELISPEAAASIAKPYLSKQDMGVAEPAGAGPVVIIGDYSEVLRTVTREIRAADKAGGIARYHEVQIENVSAEEIIQAYDELASASNDIGDPLPDAKLVVAPGDDAVLLVCASRDFDRLVTIIRSLDEAASLSSVVYPINGFAPQEVEDILTKTVAELIRPADWRLVRENLTGSLVIRTTRKGHELVEETLDRLAQAPPDRRSRVRQLIVRNRDPIELAEVLAAVIQAEGIGLDAPGISTRSDGDGNRTADDQGMPSPLTVAEQESRAAINDGDATSTTTARTSGYRGRSAEITNAQTPVTLTVDSGTSSIIAAGPPLLLDEVELLFRMLDVLQSQVMLEVLLVSLDESESRDLGVELQYLVNDAGTLVGLSSLFGLSDINPVSAGSALGSGSGGTAVVLDPGDFSAVVRALENISEGRSLSMPKVLVNNNEQATIDSVREEPFLQVNASDTVATTTVGGESTAGTQVTVTPQIAEGDHIAIQYSIALSAFVGESADPALPPPRQENSIESRATIPDGYTIGVGGIEITTEGESVSQIPLLGDIPGIGELFKTRSTSSSTSRFYAFIRANVMRSETFEDLKHLSAADLDRVGADDGWPEVEPRIIR